MFIQYNEHIRNSANISKTELKALAEDNNSLSKWKTKDVSVDELIDIISQGYSVRPGIKKGGNTEDFIVSTEWLMLDLDNQTLAETLSNPWTKYAVFWYYTPSYQPGVNEKHRLMFKFDLTRGKNEYEHIYKGLMKFYPKADNTKGAGWIFFGSYQQAINSNVDTIKSVTILNKNATLPTEAFLKMDVSENTNTDKFNKVNCASTPEDSDPAVEAGGIRSQVLSWLNKEIWLGKCGNDIDKLYCLHKHNFIDQPKGKALAKWGGHRPEDTEKNTGTGFFVFWYNPNQVPVWQNQATGEKGGYFEYWHKYSRELYGKEWGAIEWELDKDWLNLQAICDDIANYFKVKLFDFAKAKKEISDRNRKKYNSLLDEVIGNYIYEDRNAGNYIFYDLNCGVWRIKSERDKIYNYCIHKAFIDMGIEIEMVENPKFARAIKSELGLKSLANVSKQQFDDMRNYDWLPLGNGDFNLFTKEFKQGFEHTLYSQFRYGNYLYTTPDKSELTLELKLFFEWLEWTYKDKSTRQAVIDWLALNIMGLAQKTQIMMCFWGTPGTGKSVILSLINNMMGELCAAIQGRKLLSSDNRFIFQRLDGIYAVTIDEFKTNQTGWDSIKELTGSETPVIEVEKKGLQPYTTKFRAGITTASQDKFTVPNSDDGGVRRRVIPIQHMINLRNPKYTGIDSILKKPEYYKQIFFWLLNNIDAGEAIERMKKFANSNEVKTNMLQILIEQDDVLAFIFDCLEFTDNPNDVVPNTELQLAYENYLQSEKLQHLTEKDKQRINNISQYVREKARIPDNKITWNLCPASGKNERISINGKQIKGLRGLKVRLIQNNDVEL